MCRCLTYKVGHVFESWIGISVLSVPAHWAVMMFAELTPMDMFPRDGNSNIDRKHSTDTFLAYCVRIKCFEQFLY